MHIIRALVRSAEGTMPEAAIAARAADSTLTDAHMCRSSLPGTPR